MHRAAVFTHMSKVDIETAAELPPEELACIRARCGAFDERIERKLDKALAEARANRDAGRREEL